MSDSSVTPRPPQHHPSDLVAAVLGSHSVTLTGFGAAPMTPSKWSWVAPGMATPVLTGEATDGAEAINARARRLRLLRRVIATLIAAAALFLGYIVGTQREAIEGQATRQAASAWVTKSITEDGLVLSIEGREVLFRVGDTLPSGEVLQDTDPQGGRYRTNRSVVTLRATDAAAAASGAAAPASFR
jgi:hypothetical protein